jgi:hypothetical protein
MILLKRLDVINKTKDNPNDLNMALSYGGSKEVNAVKLIYQPLK